MFSKAQGTQAAKNVAMQSLYRFHCLQYFDGRQTTTMLEEATLDCAEFRRATMTIVVGKSCFEMLSELIKVPIAVQSLVLFQFYKL